MSDAPVPLPPELAELQGLAAGTDAAMATAALPPGAEPPEEVDPADELADLLNVASLAVGKVLPTVPKYFTREANAEIVGAYLECAEKYGWTAHEGLKTLPEVKLGLALGVPAFLCFMETKQWIEWQREQQRQAAAGQAGAKLQPVPADGA